MGANQMSDTEADRSQRRRLGGWLPTEEDTVAAFRLELAARAYERKGKALRASPVRELSDLVQNDAVLRMDMSNAIEEAIERGFQLGYGSIDDLMLIIDYSMSYAPPFSESDLIHCPLNAILDWPMCMPSGYALFRDPALNAQLKRVLNCWSGFLSGPHSRRHLHEHTPDGWFSPEADRHIGLSQFLCDRARPHWGFASWNDFFTRQFTPEARPVAAPGDDKVIVSACEASPYNIEHDIRLRDTFWIKAQPYSLQDIFAARDPELADRFVGGSVYQAFLSAFNYHRWHAPVSGVVTHAYIVDGTYFSDAEAEGEDPGGLNDSQGYTTAVATRAVIVLESDDRDIGPVACIFVGMADVSSCLIEVVPGQRLQKGQELGYFQYGGSTCCMIFGAGVIDRFIPSAPFHDDAPPIKVNSHVATARQAPHR
jgi:phosphatidylserine decarboxylase